MLVARTLYLMWMSRRLGSSRDGVGLRPRSSSMRGSHLCERLDAEVRGQAGGVEVVRARRPGRGCSQPKFGRITRSPGAVPRMMKIDWRIALVELRHGDAARAIDFDGVLPTPAEKVASHVPSLFAAKPPLDEAPACAALEAEALLVAIDRDFPLATERAAKVLLAAGGDLVEHVLPDHGRLFVHRALPLQPDSRARKV